MMLPKVVMLQKLVESGVIAVIRKLPEDKVGRIADSLIEGGVTALEVTVDSPVALLSIGHVTIHPIPVTHTIYE